MKMKKRIKRIKKLAGKMPVALNLMVNGPTTGKPVIYIPPGDYIVEGCFANMGTRGPAYRKTSDGEFVLCDNALIKIHGYIVAES